MAVRGVAVDLELPRDCDPLVARGVLRGCNDRVIVPLLRVGRGSADRVIVGLRVPELLRRLSRRLVIDPLRGDGGLELVERVDCGGAVLRVRSLLE